MLVKDFPGGYDLKVFAFDAVESVIKPFAGFSNIVHANSTTYF